MRKMFASVFTSSPPGVFKSTASISGSAGALLDTPCMVLYTRRLGVPHLTVDIVEKLPASINNPLAMHFSFGHL
jgi:hypothetical protein